MYYRLYDLQCGRYMYTGYNCDLKGLIETYRMYIDQEQDDEIDYEKLSDSEILNMIKSNEFSIEVSQHPFEERDLNFVL